MLEAINEGGAEISMLDVSNPQKDEIETLSEVIWNLTKKLKQQNYEINQEQKKLSAVLNHMTDAVVIVDGSGIVKLFNPAPKLCFKWIKIFP